LPKVRGLTPANYAAVPSAASLGWVGVRSKALGMRNVEATTETGQSGCGHTPKGRSVHRPRMAIVAVAVSASALLLAGCGGGKGPNGSAQPGDAQRVSGRAGDSLKDVSEASLAAKSFTVAVSTTGDIVYQATMHYNAPDRIDLLTIQAGVTVESISIGTNNYVSDRGNLHRFISGTGGSPFATTVLNVLKALETAHVTSQAEGRFAVTEVGPPSVAAEVTTNGGFVSGITLHYPTNTTTYTFTDFNTGPPVTAPSAGQIGNTGQTFPDGSPVPKCNRDGSIPTGTDVCIG